MSTVWITYAWADNEHGDIDFVAQELEEAGLTVKLDRWMSVDAQKIHCSGPLTEAAEFKHKVSNGLFPRVSMNNAFYVLSDGNNMTFQFK